MMLAVAASTKTRGGFVDDIVIADATYYYSSNESSTSTIYIRRLSAKTGEVMWSYAIPSAGRISDNTKLRTVSMIRISAPNDRVWFTSTYRYATSSGRTVNEAVCLNYTTGALISRAYATFCPQTEFVSHDGLTVLGGADDEDDEYICRANTSVKTLDNWRDTSSTSYYPDPLGIAQDGTYYYSLRRVPSGDNEFTIYEQTEADSGGTRFYYERLPSGSPTVYLWDIDHGYCLMGGQGAHPNGLYNVDRQAKTFTKVKDMAFLANGGVYFKDFTHLGTTWNVPNTITLKDCETGSVLKTYDTGRAVSSFAADSNRNVYFISGDTLYRFDENDEVQSLFTSKGSNAKYRKLMALCCEPASFITHPDLYA